MGQEQAARPIVIAPAFALPEFGDAGFMFPLTITFIGHRAIGYVDDVWESLRIDGADLGLGLGDDHIPFHVLPGPNPDRREIVSLPLGASDIEMIPEVEIELTSPLFLNRSLGDRKEPLLRPGFSDSMRAGLRALGPLHKLYGEALPESVFAHLKAVAGNVPTLRSEFREFTQANVIAKFKVPMVTRTVEDSKRHFLNWRRLQLGRGKAIEPTPTRIPDSSKLRNYYTFLYELHCKSDWPCKPLNNLKS